METAPSQFSEQNLACICKALGNPVRVQIVRYIQQHPGCIGNQILLNLPDDASRSQSTLSQHLKILCAAGLIDAEPDGTAVTYRLSHECLQWLRAQIRELDAA